MKEAGPNIFIDESSVEANESQVVILFGGWNIPLNHVSKYTQYYRNKGYTTSIVLCSNNEFDVVSMTGNENQDPKAFACLTERLLQMGAIIPLQQTVDQNGTTNNHNSTINPPATKCKLVLHIFSNGGIFRLRHWINALHSQQKQFIPGHIILDSCPGHLSVAIILNFLTVGITNPVYRRLARLLLLTKFTFKSWNWDLKKHPVTVNAPYAVSQKNNDGNVFGPRLFLYSDSDQLVLRKHVESWINKAQQEEGMLVDAVLFQGSKHIQHALQHPKEYWAAVDKFLKAKL
ncbi:UNVERIFIED_CONTAM: hypothetical protein HDU68_008509 [Siphonaria sp. JEL0065]|nr:hypothetical protein HDU68_008509 [Siphonaria sp. JEL0065]